VQPAQNDDPAQAFSNENFYFYLDGPFKSPEEKSKKGIKPYREDPAKATGNDCFKAEPHIFDWYETAKINYGFHPTTGQESYDPMPVSWPFMLSVLKFWIGLGVDGFRCDMVDMVPVRFWRWALAEVRKDCPECLFIGESYDPNRYQGLLDAGFDYLYDKVGLYDASLAWLEGRKPAGVLGTALWNNRPYEGRLLRFSENHDEVRLSGAYGFGKTFDKEEEAIAAGTKAFAFAALAGAGPLMVYMGQELAEPGEEAEGFSGADGKTTIFDYWSVKSLRRLSHGGAWDGGLSLPEEKKVQGLYRRLIQLKNTAGQDARLYNLHPANPDGYGEIGIEDGFCFLLYNQSRFFLVLMCRKDRKAAWQAILPADFFISSGLSIRPKNIKALFPAEGDAEITLSAAPEGGLILGGQADTRFPLILEL
jgi:glycosidase